MAVHQQEPVRHAASRVECANYTFKEAERETAGKVKRRPLRNHAKSFAAPAKQAAALPSGLVERLGG